MKAIVIEKLGSPNVLKLKEIDKPQPLEDEVLIRNFATSINTIDIIFRNGKPPKVMTWSFRKIFTILLRLGVGLRKPKRPIPGSDYAGEIVTVGKNVTDWKQGDHVYGYARKACAEFMVVHKSKLARKPENVSFLEAGAVPGAATVAMIAFRDPFKLQKGQKLLIIGASGGIGTYAVQIAKYIYEAEVTGVCGPSNVDMVKEIGADFVIDYTKGDYSKNGIKYDVILDVVGKNTFSRCKKILSENGLYISNNFLNSKKHLLQLITSKFTSKKLKGISAYERTEDFDLIRDWIEEGKIKSVIDSVYPLDQTAKAHLRYETGHAKGRVVISIE